MIWEPVRKNNFEYEIRNFVVEYGDLEYDEPDWYNFELCIKFDVITKDKIYHISDTKTYNQDWLPFDTISGNYANDERGFENVIKSLKTCPLYPNNVGLIWFHIDYEKKEITLKEEYEKAFHFNEYYNYYVKDDELSENEYNGYVDMLNDAENIEEFLNQIDDYEEEEYLSKIISVNYKTGVVKENEYTVININHMNENNNVSDTSTFVCNGIKSDIDMNSIIEDIYKQCNSYYDIVKYQKEHEEYGLDFNHNIIKEINAA